jgi:hypothetical protein
MVDTGFRLEDLEDNDPLLSLRLSEIERISAGLNLSSDERRAVCDRIEHIEELIRPFVRAVTPEPSAGQAMRMLAARYDSAVANQRREGWMDAVEFLIAPARTVQPELGTLGALQAVMQGIRVIKK